MPPLFLYKYAQNPSILCVYYTKMSCILRVYYACIVRILLSKIYSNQRTLSSKIRTIKPRKH